MIVGEIDFPYVRGHKWISAHFDPAAKIEVDLNEVARIEVEGVDGWRTAFAVLGVTAAVLAVVALIVALTKESCPILYVEGDDGWQLVGEAYAGAAFRSIQRPDLLPLPGPTKERLSLMLANEARETQYTDLVELVLADHPQGTRVVSTVDQEVLLVGDVAPPLRVVDVAGSDVTTRVASTDRDVWRTDLSQFVDHSTPPVSESLIATFPRPAPGERPVLELVLSNTYWADLVFGRFFALMGDDLDKYLERGNRPESGPRIDRWREREGVDLTVEWKRGNTWEKIDVVRTVGPVALRRVAVPLPAVPAGDGPETITVRVTGGTGFWQFDEVGLSLAREGALHIHRVAPVVAKNANGEDERETVASVDGRYQVLEEMDERLHLEFATPPAPPNGTRSAFFFSNGYYNVHPPIQSQRSRLTLKRILEEQGSFARFGIDLYRRYHEITVATGAPSPPVPEAP
jgi:hypothetical protein